MSKPHLVLTDVHRHYGAGDKMVHVLEAANLVVNSGELVALVAPSGAGNIPFQLVKANPAMGSGAMMGVTYIQRVALKGGAAPATGCTVDTKGAKVVVPYQGDYIFWKAS